MTLRTRRLAVVGIESLSATHLSFTLSLSALSLSSPLGRTITTFFFWDEEASPLPLDDDFVEESFVRRFSLGECESGGEAKEFVVAKTSNDPLFNRRGFRGAVFVVSCEPSSLLLVLLVVYEEESAVEDAKEVVVVSAAFWLIDDSSKIDGATI